MADRQGVEALSAKPEERKKQGYGFSEKEVTKEITKYEEAAAELQNAISVIEKKRADNESRIVELRALKAALEGESIKLEKSLHLESGDISLSLKQKEELKNALKNLPQ